MSFKSSRRKIVAIGIFLTLAPVSLPQGLIAGNGIIDENVVATNDFAFALFRVAYEGDATENILLSPMSLQLASAMTANGAGGDTRDSMLLAMKIRVGGIDQANRQLISLTKHWENSNCDLRIANSIWVSDGFEVKDHFKNIILNDYGAYLDVMKDTATVNKWVRDHTENKIDGILDKVEKDDVMALLNAVYFAAEWRDKFEDDRNMRGDFFLVDGQRKSVVFMNRCGEYNFLETGIFRAVELPYAESDISMFIFLPAEKIGLNRLIDEFDPRSWRLWLSKFTMQTGKVSLPHFTVEYSKKLNNVLSEMGMGIAFDGSRADFSGITDDSQIWIDRVKHKCHMEVSNEGTVASAASAVVMKKGPPAIIDECGGFEMKVDRPFFCAVYDNKSSVFLFTGAIVDGGQ